MTNRELAHLHLNEHRMTDEGCKALGKALEINASLHYVSLEATDPLMSIQGIQALLKGIKNNCELVKFDLATPDEWPPQIGRELNVYLERNRVISPLLKADLPLGMWPRVMKRVCNPTSPDLLYALVKEKCDLFRSIPITRARERRRTRR